MDMQQLMKSEKNPLVEEDNQMCIRWNQAVDRALISGISEEQIINAALTLYENGWSKLKFYFICGLPTETLEDMDEMAELLTNFDREGFSKMLKERHNLTMDDTLTQVKVDFSNVYVYEVEPKYIRVVAVVNIDNANYLLPISFSFKDGKLGIGKSDFGNFYQQMVIDTALTVIKLLETINHKSWTVVSNDTPVKVKSRVGRNLTKYKYKPSNIVYVTTEHKFRTAHPELSPKIINKPNYAYEVRGHWRRLQHSQIGKDREGLRGVKGFTWVTPFIKGEGEVMKKIRIVK